MKSLDDISLQSSDRAAISEAAELLRRRFPVVDVILFGSKARGDDDAESDIDLLLITARALSRADRHAVTDALFPLQLTHDVVLSVVIVSVDEWRDGVVTALPIHDEILEQGVAA